MGHQGTSDAGMEVLTDLLACVHSTLGGTCGPTDLHQATGSAASDPKLRSNLGAASQGALVVKNPPANARDRREVSSVPESGRSPGGGHGNPLQYSCLENPMDRGAWRAAVHGVTESGTRLKHAKGLP